jgi:hypothetical protein
MTSLDIGKVKMLWLLQITTANQSYNNNENFATAAR